MTGNAKIIHLYKGAQDGMEIHTTEDIKCEDVFWVPSHDLLEIMSGSSFSEIRDILEDPENEYYLPYESHLIAYVLERELDSEQGLPTYLYSEYPLLTHARIEARENYDQEHQ